MMHNDKIPVVVSKRKLISSFVEVATELSPYLVPDKLSEAANGLSEAASEAFAGGSTNQPGVLLSLSEDFRARLLEWFAEVPEIQEWAKPKKARDPEDPWSSDPDYGFIDPIDLAYGVARECCEKY